MNFPADNFCIWQPASPRCRPYHGSRGRKPIRCGPVPPQEADSISSHA